MAETTKRTHRDLYAWKLADALRREILRLMATDRVAKNQRFRSQGEDAAGSTCRNLAEGFKRFHPPEFATFARYAAASNAEVGDALEEGVERAYWTEDEATLAQTLVKRTAGAIGSLQRYLRSPRARQNAASILRAHEERPTSRSPDE